MYKNKKTKLILSPAVIAIIFFISISSFLLSDKQSSVIKDRDLSLLIHGNMFNNLFSKSGNLIKKIKKWDVTVSNLNFQFYNGRGQLNINVKIQGKKKIISIEKKVKVDMTLKYDFEKHIIVLEIDKVKINFGKLIGDIDFSKLISVENYVFPVPEIESDPILVNKTLITPTIVDAEATFIDDAISLSYKIEYK